MSVKLLWKALGSNHRMFVVQWRMQLSLSGLLPWMIGPTDHTQKHIGNSFGSVLVASESYCHYCRLSSQRANQISILPGQGQVIQLHLAHRHRIISISLPQLRHLIIIVSSTINKITTHSHLPKKKKHRHRLSRTILSSHHVHQRKNQKKKSKEEEVTVKIRYLVKRKCIISGESE